MERHAYTRMSHPDDDRELFLRANSGDLDAREQIILNYIPLVKKCVTPYIGKGVPYDDLYQEGCYGLLVALAHYDPSRNTKFSSYSIPWMLKYVKKALAEQNENYPVRVREDIYYDLQAYIEAVNRFYEEFDRQPTDQELSDYSNIDIKKIQLYKSVFSHFLIPAVSIEDNPKALVPKYPQHDRPVEKELFQQVKPEEICSDLTETEVEILRRRLGYTLNGCETWKQIAAATGLTLCNAAKIYHKAINKLRDCIDEF